MRSHHRRRRWGYIQFFVRLFGLIVFFFFFPPPTPFSDEKKPSATTILFSRNNALFVALPPSLATLVLTISQSRQGVAPVRTARRASVGPRAAASAVDDECALDNFQRVSVLAEALPYLQRFAGQTIVVKYGGAAMKDESLKDRVIRDLVLLSTVGRAKNGSTGKARGARIHVARLYAPDAPVGPDRDLAFSPPLPTVRDGGFRAQFFLLLVCCHMKKKNAHLYQYSKTR